MSDYDFRPGGTLKLKGKTVDGGVKKKKKFKSKDKDAAVKEILKRDSPTPGSPSGSGRNSPAIAGSSADRKTEAERRFQEVQRKRLADKVKRLANQTHKDRVHDFNTKLESLSEHHDIPKVGPG